MTNASTLRRKYLTADAALGRAMDRAAAFPGPVTDAMLADAKATARAAYAAWRAVC